MMEGEANKFREWKFLTGRISIAVQSRAENNDKYEMINRDFMVKLGYIKVRFW